MYYSYHAMQEHEEVYFIRSQAKAQSDTRSLKSQASKSGISNIHLRYTQYMHIYLYIINIQTYIPQIQDKETPFRPLRGVRLVPLRGERH